MNSVKVSSIPNCDLCEAPAAYDARIPFIGCWGNVCEHHFKTMGCELGLGKGQRLEGPSV